MWPFQYSTTKCISHWFWIHCYVVLKVFKSFSLRENCSNTEFFWSILTRNRTENGPEKLRIWVIFTQCLFKHGEPKLNLKSDPNLKKNHFICFNESPLNMMKNTLYFMLKALFVLGIFKACVRYFWSNFYFQQNDSPSKTMQNVFYFIVKALFFLEIFKFLYFCLPLFFSLSAIALEVVCR